AGCASKHTQKKKPGGRGGGEKSVWFPSSAVINPNPRSATSFLMVPDILWTSFPERTASRCRGLFESGPRRAHSLRVHLQVYPLASSSKPCPHPALPRERGREIYQSYL